MAAPAGRHTGLSLPNLFPLLAARVSSPLLLLVSVLRPRKLTTAQVLLFQDFQEVETVNKENSIYVNKYVLLHINSYIGTKGFCK